MPPLILPLACAFVATLAAPLTGENSYGPIPGQTPLYNDYRGISAPFPAGKVTGPTLPTASGPPGPEDYLWQNLVAAEWTILAFYQHAVELFNISSFTSLGLPITTYGRIVEIRDNEAGHLNIFYREISNTSTKPGPCEYDFGFEHPLDPEFFLGEQVFIELSSISFLSGLVNQAVSPTSRSALVVVGSVETRHNAWALTNSWGIDPFDGPADAAYPWPEQILGLTTRFIKNGSCPVANPAYPYPNQEKPAMSFITTVSSGHPGEAIQFTFPGHEPKWKHGKEYYAVFVHAINNITVPFDPKTGMSTVPAEFDSNRGLIYALIVDQPGAPCLESMLAGPLTLLQQPAALTTVIGGI
ncbi:hypothetical protein LTR62_006475 [Meristemomyces frigidus]|uniref:Uncharacterized protein n=1 Tax=Meristemomyces frigidus TaxID=1508187 RepID=A0AAN7TJU1_9PEZI|nr:hypothetical protein LTR62_006475 [Meristemomyces frigidus]